MWTTSLARVRPVPQGTCGINVRGNAMGNPLCVLSRLSSDRVSYQATFARSSLRGRAAWRPVALVIDNFSPHLSTKRDRRLGVWAEANNVELAYTPTSSSWLNRIEAQFTALRHFALDGTDHRTFREQGSMICRYLIWRNRHVEDVQLRRIVNRANVA